MVKRKKSRQKNQLLVSLIKPSVLNWNLLKCILTELSTESYFVGNDLGIVYKYQIKLPHQCFIFPTPHLQHEPHLWAVPYLFFLIAFTIVFSAIIISRRLSWSWISPVVHPYTFRSSQLQPAHLFLAHPRSLFPVSFQDRCRLDCCIVFSTYCMSEPLYSFGFR